MVEPHSNESRWGSFYVLQILVYDVFYVMTVNISIMLLGAEVRALNSVWEEWPLNCFVTIFTQKLQSQIKGGSRELEKETQ